MQKKTKNIEKLNKPINQMSKKKKIGFLSAIMFVIGSSIGAGIFIKNGEITTNTGDSILLAVIAWVIAFVGIFSMALALIEIVSASKVDNKEGIVGWVKTFSNKYLYLGCRNFMAYVYLPINIFAMPYYVVQQLNEGVGWDAEWYWVALIAFAVMVYFVITTALSSKLANIQNWISLIIKFFPLIVATCIGFVYLAMNNGQFTNNPITPMPTPEDKTQVYFNNISPILGIFMSIPSILFVVDGFYSSTAIQTSMREPKKMSKAILVGLMVITVIDLLIALSLMFGPKQGGGIGIFSDWMPSWLYETMQILITIGILGIVNGMCAYSGKMYEDMIENKTILFHKQIVERFGLSTKKATIFYALVINITIFLLATLIGCFFINTSIYTEYSSDRLCSLYSFIDLTANWTSLFAFLIIVMSLIGGLRNRKTKEVTVTKSKYFYVPAIITTVIIFTSVVMEIVKSVGNIGLAIAWFNDFDDRKYAVERLVGSILMVLTMILFFMVIAWPTMHAKVSNKYRMKVQ